MSIAAEAASEVSPEIWRAIVGSSIRVPAINSYVYYFPQGHLENCSAATVAASTAENYYGNPASPLILCQVLSLRFLSSRSSDESFVKFLPKPIHQSEARGRLNPIENEVNFETDITSFSKGLTPSDASSGGGFSVPKYCADSIFPLLNLLEDPPAQNLSVRDTHNNAWLFRHIFRGTPRRHLLTTGWSKFISDKRLVAGDSIVFIKRNSTRELFIGIKRSTRFGSINDLDRGVGSNSIDVASRAIENAAIGMLFEVDYYPRAGFPDYVVTAERVEGSLMINWNPGMEVRMLAPTNDPLRTAWFKGRITATTSQVSSRWPNSPWRKLQVSWDEPGILPNMNRVSPWEVKSDPQSTSHTLATVAHHKKLKVLQNPTILSGEREISFPLNPDVLFHYAPFPTGVERDMRDHMILADAAECDVSYPSFTELLKRGMDKKPKYVSKMLNIGSSHPERSPDIGGQTSDYSADASLAGQLGQPHILLQQEMGSNLSNCLERSLRRRSQSRRAVVIV